MNFEKLYKEIKTCPWCLGKPTLTITPYPNKVTFDVRLGCRNIKNCLFNPYQKLTCSIDELDSCVDEIIDNWNGRTESVVQPSQVTITADTESKWVLSEPDKEEETNDTETEHKCTDCEYFDTRTNTCWLNGSLCPNGCDCFRRVCSDCKNYWYCAGEECCNLDEPSFPEPCDKFEMEDS